MLQVRDPILTHVALDGVLEWVSVEDSARLMVGIAEGAPPEFWGAVHNVGGGEGWRLTNWQLQVAIAGALGARDVRSWYERNWFATRNFHGHWFTDSDALEALVPFRQDTFEGALARAVHANPRLKAARLLPGAVVKKLVMEPLTRRPRGTMAYVAAGDDQAIRAFYGSRESFDAIGDWGTFWPPRPCRTPSVIDHGYDEDKAPATWGIEDYRQVAHFRGGVLMPPRAEFSQGPPDLGRQVDRACCGDRDREEQPGGGSPVTPVNKIDATATSRPSTAFEQGVARVRAGVPPGWFRPSVSARRNHRAGGR